MIDYDVIAIILAIIAYFRYLGPIIVMFKTDHPDAVPPKKAYGRPACFDLTAVEDVVIKIGNWQEIDTGITYAPWPHIYIPFLKLTITPFGNVAYRIHTRSGMARRKGLRAHLGIFDNDYRNKITVVLFNHNPINSVYIRKGERIGQVEFYRVPSVWFFQRKKLSNSMRGDKGFGSTGV